MQNASSVSISAPKLEHGGFCKLVKKYGGFWLQFFALSQKLVLYVGSFATDYLF